MAAGTMRYNKNYNNVNNKNYNRAAMREATRVALTQTSDEDVCAACDAAQVANNMGWYGDPVQETRWEREFGYEMESLRSRGYVPVAADCEAATVYLVEVSNARGAWVSSHFVERGDIDAFVANVEATGYGYANIEEGYVAA